eukprot:447966-Rhodomonas_salina.1
MAESVPAAPRCALRRGTGRSGAGHTGWWRARRGTRWLEAAGRGSGSRRVCSARGAPPVPPPPAPPAPARPARQAPSRARLAPARAAPAPPTPSPSTPARPPPTTASAAPPAAARASGQRRPARLPARATLASMRWTKAQACCACSARAGPCAGCARRGAGRDGGGGVGARRARVVGAQAVPARVPPGAQPPPWRAAERLLRAGGLHPGQQRPHAPLPALSRRAQLHQRRGPPRCARSPWGGSSVCRGSRSGRRWSVRGRGDGVMSRRGEA